MGHRWRSRDELVSDVLWTPAHGRTKEGRPVRTYIQQLCADAGCSPENLPKAKDDREVWREMVRNIRADSAIWWWWLFEMCKYHLFFVYKYFWRQFASKVYAFFVFIFLHRYYHEVTCRQTSYLNSWAFSIKGWNLKQTVQPHQEENKRFLVNFKWIAKTG